MRVNNLQSLIVVIVFLLLTSTSVFAGKYTYNNHQNGSSIGLGTLNVEDDQWFNISSNSSWSSQYMHASVENLVRFKYTGQRGKYFNTAWSYKVVFSARGYDENNTLVQVNNGNPIELTVSYDESGATDYVDEAVYTFSGLHSVEVYKISLINLTGNLSDVPEDLYLENEINIERYYFLSVTEQTIIQSDASIATSGVGSLKFYWNTIVGAEEYDLEWCFVPASSNVTYATNGSDINDKRFTRVTVGDNSYTINLVYEKGQIYYRVRPVGRFWEKLSQRKEGAWSYCSMAYDVENFHESDKNWSYQATYAEEGKRKEVVSYADGSSRNRQTVTHLNTEGKALIGETFYDFEGRPAIQTLPSPEQNENGSLQFYTSFNQNSDDIAFGKKDFDIDGSGTACNPLLGATMSINSGASRYYSPNNNNQNEQQAYLPDAKKYPYTRTVYDKNGRVKMQSGPGEAHRLGNGNETKYYYGRPLQEDIDRLFGNEAGESKHYSLQAVEDANGQVSLSYMNLSGKTVATSLVGKTDNLEGIGSLPITPINITSNLLSNNEYFSQENMYEVNMSYLVKAPGVHNFKYNVTPETFTSLCSGGTFDCKYDVEITIYDECGNLMEEEGYDPQTPPSILAQVHQYESAVAPTPITFSVNFTKVGTYKISKRLILNQDQLDIAKSAYEAHLRSAANTCFDLATLTNNIIGGIDNSGCSNCADYCLTHNCPPGYCDDVYSQTPSYDAAENCTEAYENLLEDMSPGGQYFDNDPITGGTGIPNSGWFQVYVVDYYNGLGIGSGNFYTDFGFTALGIGSWQDIIDNWDASWATTLPASVNSGSYVFNGLVDFHPEICHVGWCTLSSESKNHDQTLANTATLVEAYNAGYFPIASNANTSNLSVISLLNQDPVSNVSAYTSVLGSSSLFYTELSNGTFWNEVITATQAAYTTPTDDDYWFIGKSMYIQRKNELMHDLQITTCPYMCEDRDPGHGSLPDGITDGCNGEAPGFVINYMNVQTLIETPDLTDGTNAEAYGNDVEALICETVAIVNLEDYITTICGSPSFSTLHGVYNGGSSNFTALFNFTCASLPTDAEDLATLLVTEINNYGVFEARSDGAMVYIETTNTSLEGTTIGLKGTETLTVGTFINTCDAFKSDCICEEFNLLYASMEQEFPSLSESAIYDSVQMELENLYNITIPTGSIQTWAGDCDADNAMPEATYAIIDSLYPALLSNCNPAFDPCQTEETEALTNFYANQAFEELIFDALEIFENDYINHCLGVDVNNNFNELFTMEALSQEHHYTLFYYDLVGNLTRTVPPAGVATLNSQELEDVATYRADPVANAALYTIPSHSLITKYQYNTLNQLTRQTTPDGGTTNFWYDGIGRLILSIDAEQALNWTASYVFYDGLGRTEEAGVFVRSSAPWPDLSNQQAFRNWVTSSMQMEVLVSDYDAVTTTTSVFTAQESENMRGRIAATYFYNDLSEPYESASFYSYDVHGNVQSLITENTLLADIGQAHKRTDYVYDLISGNVNQVNYQQGELDQFIHRYDYDADNRITNVYTSQDGYIWDRDANYSYYDHGPLARVELGNKTVQGLDYAYTIQGWLKGVNGNQLNPTTEMGKDGSLGLTNHYNTNQLQQHRAVARDAFGFTLSYFEEYNFEGNVIEGDYKAISINGDSFINNLSSTITAGSIGANGLGNNLFNGNIKSMATAIKDINETAIDYNVSVYGYDQLNRIKEYNVNLGTDFNNMQNNGEYFAQYKYDGNGNLLTLLRNGSLHLDKDGNPIEKMDDFQYHYYLDDNVTTYLPVEGVQSPNGATNRLAYVVENYTDSEPSGGYTGPEFGDIQSGQSTSNYQYDAKGQLIKDLQEGIENIEWYQSGKVKAIKRDNEGNDVRFYYDPMGNRIAKVVKPRNGSGVLLGQEEWVYTFYSRDASGNPLATYSKKYESLQGGGSNDYELHYALEEQTLYGSSRLGVKNSGKDLVSQDIRVTNTVIVDGGNTFESVVVLANHTVTSEDLGFNTRNVGYKNYELSNHLGNVLAVVTDQKIAIDDHSYIYIGNNDEHYDFNASLGVFHQNASVTGQYKYSPSSGDGVVDYYEANVVSYSDYYPFGMLQPNRNGGEYRYGYQGSEKDNEVKGKGNSYTTHFRQLDPRLGKWLSIDPKASSLPWQSPYCSMDNNPIWFNDPMGDKVKIKGKRKERKAIKEELQKSREESTIIDDMISDFENSKEVFIYQPGSDNIYRKDEKGRHVIDLKLSYEYKANGRLHKAKMSNQTIDGIIFTPTITIGHETGHAWLALHNLDEVRSSVQINGNEVGVFDKPVNVFQSSGSIVVDVHNKNLDIRIQHEKRASHIENMVRGELDIELREIYGELTRAEKVWSQKELKDMIIYKPVLVPAKKEGYDYKEVKGIHSEFGVEPIPSKK